MKRSVGVLFVLQGAVYVALAIFLGARWAPLYGVMGLAATVQLAAGGGVSMGKPGKAWVRWAALTEERCTASLLTGAVAGRGIGVWARTGPRLRRGAGAVFC